MPPVPFLPAALLAAGIALAMPAAARDGDLDAGFAAGAVAVMDFGAQATAYGLAIGPDGRIVLAGMVEAGATGRDLAVAVLSRGGQPDAGFSFDGMTTVAVGPGDADDFHMNAIVQANGRIVTAGFGPDSATPGDDEDMQVVRLLADGTLDPSFNGDGKAFIAFDLGDGNVDRALDLVELPGGKLIVVGAASVAGQGQDFALVKLNADGSRDTTFDGDGRVTFHFDLDPANREDIASSVALDGAGNIVVGGIAESGPNSHDFAIARLTPDGALDPNFGGDGRVTLGFDLGGNLDDQLLELAVAPDGAIYAGGMVASGGTDFGVVKLQPDGSPDLSWGDAGRASVAFDLGGPQDVPYGLVVQPDGKVVLTGFAQPTPSGADIALARLDAAGALDPTFGFAGKRTYDLALGGDSFDAALRGRLQDGYLVIGGVVSTTPATTGFMAARVVIDTLHSDGFDGQ
jgi:uncharacterized delta-60 repeat protein